MNKVVAVFIFRNSDQADRTLNFLWSKLSGGFERSAGSEVWISSSCDDTDLASQICISCGGTLK